MSKVALLDVNVLIALLDPEHVTHEAAHTWFQANQHYGWATCPITENGCLRILSKLHAPFGLTVEDVAILLRQLRKLKRHHFWPENSSIVEPGRFALSGLKPKTITDVYLLDIASSNDGRLVTFDRGILWQSVIGATAANLECLTAN